MFGARGDFQIARDGSVVVVTSLTGSLGETRLYSVENIYFAFEDESFTEGDLLGYAGGEGSDTIDGTARDNQIAGNGGDDILSGNGGNDSIDGGAGADILHGGDGNDILTGGTGDDLLYGERGDDQLDGGEGNDIAWFTGNSVDYALTWTPEGQLQVADLADDDGVDLLTGIETLRFAGDDATIMTADVPLPEPVDEDEVLEGTAGNDLLDGMGGNDVLNGYAGDDLLIGGDGDDVLNGGEGDDLLAGGAGSDLLDGGEGTDVAIFEESSTDVLIFNSPDVPGALCVSSLASTDIVMNVEQLYFAGDSATLTPADIPPLGTAQDDVIVGTARGEVLYGFEGDDVFITGAGGSLFDFVDGGEGYDQVNYSGASTDYQVNQFPDGSVTVQHIAGNEGMDQIIQVEALYFSADDMLMTL